MSDFDINYDLRPYIPDIYIKNNIYNSFDAVNNNNNIGINSIIFIFNINENLQSRYNDPSYLLYGIKKPNSIYEYPSLNFFYKSESGNIQTDNFNVPYKSNNPVYKINDALKTLLNSIGYDISKINENEFQYQELYITESISNSQIKVIYIYFNLTESDILINYNKYSSSTYYQNKYWNILIYPYIKTSISPYIQSNVFYDFSNGYNKLLNQKTIDTIDFDDRENIKYYEKIDYKYFENINYTISNKTSLETLRNYSYYIKNYNKYVNSQINKKVIYFNLNEISKIYYPTSEYTQKYNNSYTNTYLNNKHINNYKSYSQNINKYSYSFDNKISNLENINSLKKNYSCYNYDSLTNTTIYEQYINFYVNSYFDYDNYSSKNQNSLVTINCNLYKIFLFINPKIIDNTYLLNKIKTKISPLITDSNILTFGLDDKKLQLYINGNIKSTNLYYINKYKIEFEFESEFESEEELVNTQIIYNYTIILGITFYNSNNISILNKDITKNSSNLGYINYSTEENSISLSPTILNPNELLLTYEKMLNINLTNIKKYMYSLDYSFLSRYQNQNNLIQFFNFYSMISNYIPKNKTSNCLCDKNELNVKMIKINNFIKNFLNINDNFNNFRLTGENLKNYINYCILYDENIIRKNTKKCDNDCGCNYDYKNLECDYCNNSCNDDCCENNCDYYTDNEYIEYFSYFPKISNLYTSLSENFYGKYNLDINNPNNSNNNLVVLPSGKYIKFNYINYNAIYPFFSTIIDNENFVKSIKNIFNMINYNFSLLIMLPYNINQDDAFYCDSKKYFWTNQYSCNIGDNYTTLYLILNDENGNPYTFYGEYDECIEKNNGLIYGIKIFDQYNFISENLKLNTRMNLFFNKYINFTQLVLLMETYTNYSDKNNVVWNINESYLHLHNVDFLKEILNYDFKRFKNCYDKNTLEPYFNNFNYKTLINTYEYKVQLNNLRYNIKILIYISNLIKTIFLLEKCYNYCEIIRINIMMKCYNNDLLIQMIKYNTNIISNLYKINYNLSICSGTFSSDIYLLISNIYLININNSLENLNNYKNYCIYIKNYSNNKLDEIINLLSYELKNKENLFYNIYTQIYSVISIELINNWFGSEIMNDINNFISNTNLDIFNNFFHNHGFYQNQETKYLILNQIGSYLKIITLNLTKIDELLNLAKLMGSNSINDFFDINLNDKVVKNTYIYNTECYVNCSGVPVFNIIDFMSDTKELINKLSLEINNTSYKKYEKAIQQGILTFLDNTVDYFKEIIDTIVNIYKYVKNIPDISNINIYLPEEIGKFYIILTEFEKNYNSFFDILDENQISIFSEYKNLKTSFNNLSYSCQEYLLYIRLWNDFTNTNLNLFTDIFVNEDLYKIIKTDTFFDFMVKTIENFYNIIVNKNPISTLLYLEKILKNNILKMNNSFKFFVTNQINIMILSLKNEINTGIKNNTPVILYGSYYIIPYEDLLLFKEEFIPASFNFFANTLEVIKYVDEINTTIFEAYYDNPEINILYVNALGYTYLSTPFKYININNGIINE